MPSTHLGRDATKFFKDKNTPEVTESKRPSRIARIGRVVVMTFMAAFAVLSLSTGATAKAGIWDFKDELVAQVMNICNPNEVPVVTDTTSWVDSALGSTLERPVEGENKNGNIWSTYNPMVTGDGGSYVPGNGTDIAPADAKSPGGATAGWINFLRAKDGNGNFVYNDNYSDRSKVDDSGSEWIDAYKGDASKKDSYAVNPSNANAAYFNAPTVALQNAYSDAPSWVVHPSYTRYGFETLQWTTFGGGCYSPSSMLQGIPAFLYWALVQIPTLLTFGMLRITLGGELAGIFYNLIYPLTSIIGTFVKPWAALIAIFIGLPFVFTKSKGSTQKLLGGALWIAAMMFAIGFISNQDNARKFTEFSQGLVVKISGTMACTISQQAFSDGQRDYLIGGDAIKGEQQTPVYDSNGKQTGWESVTNAEQRVRNAASSQGLQSTGNEPVKVTLESLKGVGNNTTTACGSYLDGIYNAFWLGIPLQVWAEGEVGGAQAARDRSAEVAGTVGWYQAILNSMYINPNDATGRAQLEATSRWNDAPYTKSRGGKPVQWTQDGKDSGTEGDIKLDEGVSSLDSDKKATPWKTMPFLLNVKFMCKDDNPGTLSASDFGSGDIADYSANKWLYDGTCITGADSGLIAGVAGYNFVDRIGLALVGGWLAGIVGLFTIGICVYIGYQKFLWGWMLLFAPIILGIAAFPDPQRRAFARKYFEWCLANILKQVAAVIILVTTVTALGRIVFPQAIAIGDYNMFYVPWMIKPFVALMFMLSAVLFALPLRKIMVGAIKGDASVVGKVADMPADAAKAAGVAAAAAAITIGTGGAGAGALLAGAGKFAQGAAMRKGGMTGALANLASAGLDKAGNSVTEAAKAKDEAMGMGGMTRAQKKAHKKSMGTGAMSQKAALAANKQAAANGQTLPYATDKNGNLTKAAQKQAKKDFVGAQKGQFWKSPEFSAMTRNESLNGQKLDGIKGAMQGDYLDAAGNVKERALDMDAKKELAAMNAGTLDRQKAIGQDMIKADLAKPADERRYLDKAGTLTAEGQKKLFADIRGTDENGVRLANAATAAQLVADNPEHYNQFSSTEDPNGNYRVALQDANMMNFGTNGAIGTTPVHTGFSGNLEVQPIKGSQAYISAQAPVVGTDLSAADASATTQELTAAMPSMSDNAQRAMNNYANVLGDENASHTDTVAAHRDAMVALQESGNLSQTASTVTDNVLTPVDQGMSLTPAAIKQVRESVPEDSVAVRNSLESYAGVVEQHGNDSPQARAAYDHVRDAVRVENDSTYAMAAANIPTPARAYEEYKDAAQDYYQAPAVAPAPAPAPVPAPEAPAAPPAPVDRGGSNEFPEMPAMPAPREDRAPAGTSTPSYNEAPPVSEPRDSGYDYTQPAQPAANSRDERPAWAETPAPVSDDRSRSERPDWVDSVPPASEPRDDYRPEAPAAPAPAPSVPASDSSTRDYAREDREREERERREEFLRNAAMAAGAGNAARGEAPAPEAPAVPEPREEEPPAPIEREEREDNEEPHHFDRNEHALYGGIRDEKRKAQLENLKAQIEKKQNKVNQLSGLLQRRQAERDNISDPGERQAAQDRVQKIQGRIAEATRELENLKAQFDQVNRG